MSVQFARSSSTFFAASSCIAALLLNLALPSTVAAAKKKKSKKAAESKSPEELTNFLLAPQYSQWLVGAMARIATDGEATTFLGLTTDDEAASFIEEFWQRRRSKEAIWPADQPQAVFETRSVDADRLYTESARPGRRSDRGTIHVLYGPPQSVRYEDSGRPRFPPVEVWVYGKDAAPGLDGEPPKPFYYFTRRGRHTVFSPPPLRRRIGTGGA